ncbi:hypothetical protein G4228_018822 [Cervus hanglu yarkandensis]|nr:hypothetical protein G4228_018822 [Cervus hanglu yarkandensis]
MDDMIWEESMEGDEKAMWDRNQDNAGLQGRVSEDKKGPLRIVALVITVAITWIVVSILLGGLGFPRIQQLFTRIMLVVPTEPRARKYKCGLPQPCPEEHLAFRVVSGAANVIGPKICLEDRMLMSSVKDNVGRGLNIALVNGVNGDLIEARAFDMWAGDVNDLLKFIRPLHEGTLVFVASYDDPATKMNEETRKLFSDLGSKNVKDLAFRDSWVFVGAKGVQNKSPFEQVSEDELVSTLKHLVSEKLNIPVRQQRLLFKGKALADGKRLSDYSIGPNSKLNLVVKPLEKVLLEESTARKTVEAPAPPPAAWPLISRVLARHFSAADASRVLDQLQRDYERSLSRLTLDDIERLAGRFLHPEATEAMEKGFSK